MFKTARSYANPNKANGAARSARRGPSEFERQQACELNANRASQPAQPKLCAWPGCAAEAEYRAPKSRDELRSFYHFCLDHIRLYNQSWDYFKGMSPGEIEAHRRADTTWHRPTWRFGTADTHQFKDPFGFFDDQKNHTAPPVDNSASTMERRMMARLELDAGFTLAELKSHYKQMAKKHHPDLHGGDKAAEERLKLINEAYSYLLENRLYS